MTGHVGPVLGKDGAAVGINLDELNGSHSRSLESETESADAAEEIEDTHLYPLSFGLKLYALPAGRMSLHIAYDRGSTAI